MREEIMKINNMQELFELELAHAYDCEKRLMKALSKMADSAESTDLRSAFEQHLRETEEHGRRLERIFASLGSKAETESNKVVAEAVDQAEKLISSIHGGALRDAALIAAGNEVEHYEMALYGTLRDWARLLRHEDAASLLQTTLDEEKQADAKLTRIAEASANRFALQEVRA
jgi:ferritin-like metal-binding protein YciE